MIGASVNEYEAIHGTQAEQAARQSFRRVEVDGPWRLVRWATHSFEPVILPGSVRSTRGEIDRLAKDELDRTGIPWTVEPFRKDSEP